MEDMEDEIYFRRSAENQKSCFDLFFSREKIFCNVRFLGTVSIFVIQEEKIDGRGKRSPNHFGGLHNIFV